MRYAFKNAKKFAKEFFFAKYDRNALNMIVIHFLTSARGDIVPEKRQNEMLKVDSAEFSAQEGHTDAVILGVRRCAMLRIAQSSSGCSKRHGVQRYPLQPWSRDR